MQKEIIVFPWVEKIAAPVFNLLLQKSLHTAEGGFITVALSGGSTPKQIFNYISANDKGQINWNKVKLFWGDKRCVSPANEESNFRMTKQTLLDDIAIPGENIFRIWGENIPKLKAIRYGAVLTDNLKSENGLPKFDIFFWVWVKMDTLLLSSPVMNLYLNHLIFAKQLYICKKTATHYHNRAGNQ